MLLHVASVFCVLLATSRGDVSDCHKDSGPTGISECVLLNPTYNDYQWGTCLSNDYIKLISANQYHCSDTTAKYCWYQCMLESYNSMGPGVRGVCRCDAGDNSTALALPESCYSTDGSVCDWYSKCLAAKVNCNGTNAGNMFQYGYNFCQMYLQYYKQLTTPGQQWMDSVRRCLTGCLVPLLRPYNQMTCDNITKLALSTQASCYLGHGCYGGDGHESHDQDNGNWKSICQLPMADFFQVIQMINNSFSDYALAGESLCGALNIMRTCTVSHSKLKSLNSCIRAMVVSVRYISTAPIAQPYAVPSRIAGQISDNQNWASQGIQTMGCLTQGSADTSGQLVINVLVIPKDNHNCMKDLDAAAGASNKQGKQRRKRSTSTDLDQIVSEFQKAVESGRVLLNVDGQQVYVTGTGDCDPLACANVTTVSVTAPAEPAGAGRSVAGSTALFLLAAILLAAFNRQM